MSNTSRARHIAKLRSRYLQLLNKARTEFIAGRYLTPDEMRAFAYLARRAEELQAIHAEKAARREAVPSEIA